MTEKEGGGLKGALEKRRIAISSYLAAELTNNKEEYEREQEEAAKKIKKKLQGIAKNLNSLGAFPPEEAAIIKIVDYIDIKLKHGSFYNDLYLQGDGKLYVHAVDMPDPKSGIIRSVSFTEASNSEYVLLFPFVQDGIGKLVSKHIPENS